MKKKMTSLHGTLKKIKQEAHNLQKDSRSFRQQITQQISTLMQEMQLSIRIKQKQQSIIQVEFKQKLLQAQQQVRKLRQQIKSNQEQYKQQIRDAMILLQQKNIAIEHLSKQVRALSKIDNQIQQKWVVPNKNEPIQSDQSEVMMQTQILKDCLNQICNKADIIQQPSCSSNSNYNQQLFGSKAQEKQDQSSHIQLLNSFRDRLSTINQVTQCDIDDIQFLSPRTNQPTFDYSIVHQQNENAEINQDLFGTNKIYNLNRLNSSLVLLTLPVNFIPTCFRCDPFDIKPSLFQKQTYSVLSNNCIGIKIGKQLYQYQGKFIQINCRLIPSGFGTIYQITSSKDQGIPLKFYKQNKQKKTYYKGQWRNGYFHGWGKLSLSNNTIYHGRFVNGNLHGPGTIYFINQQVSQISNKFPIKFVGNFQQNQIKGQGSLQLQNGLSLSGTWTDNSLMLLMRCQ